MIRIPGFRVQGFDGLQLSGQSSSSARSTGYHQLCPLNWMPSTLPTQLDAMGMAARSTGVSPCRLYGSVASEAQALPLGFGSKLWFEGVR